jgi:outer membrane protein assembly factor BamB
MRLSCTKALSFIIPGLLVLSGLAFLLWWFIHDPTDHFVENNPGMDNRPDSLKISSAVVQIGEFFTSFGSPVSSAHGSWSRFRGDDFDNISKEKVRLVDGWGERGPQILWSIDLGEGHAAPAIFQGRVFILDYDEQQNADALRCFSLQDGREIWRRWYKVPVKRNHGMSRTIPAVKGKSVITIGPRCHVMCCDNKTGNYVWGIDLVKEYGSQVPLWYTGQCPLIDDSLAVIAVGGSALMIGVNCRTGQIVWQTPNPKHWQMSHSSIMPMQIAGKKMYVYSALGGVAGISASGPDKGQLLWETTEWNHSVIAPSPVSLPGDRIYLTAGYGAGAMMLQIIKTDNSYQTRTLFTYGPAQGLACEQQTPIFYRNCLFGILPKDAGANRNQFVCCDSNDPRRILWTSGKTTRFGLGPYIMADGKFFILSDDGVLTVAKASTEKYIQLTQTKILQGNDSWGPLAISNGLLLARDSKRLVCIDLKAI